jgi:hypothetical protein
MAPSAIDNLAYEDCFHHLVGDCTPSSNPEMVLPNSVRFDPDIHLNFKEPSRIHTMRELGYPSTYGISPVGVSEPFPLFSEQAVEIMRGEILNPVVGQEYSFSSDVSSVLYHRGYAPR